MDIFGDIFRSVFGINGRTPSNFHKPTEEPFLKDDVDDDHHTQAPDRDELVNYFENVFASFDQMFARHNQIFGSFDQMFEGFNQSFGRNFPIIEPESGESNSNSDQRSLRDQMLKEPNSEPQTWNGTIVKPYDRRLQLPDIFGRFFGSRPDEQNQTSQEQFDTDLDSVVASKGFDAALNQDKSDLLPSRGNGSSYSRHVSVKMNVFGDGKYEKSHTVIDSDGNETTTIIQSADGKQFRKTITKKRNGDVEVKDEQGDLDMFTTPRLESPSSPSGLHKGELDSKMESIFEKLFGPKGQR